MSDYSKIRMQGHVANVSCTWIIPAFDMPVPITTNSSHAQFQLRAGPPLFSKVIPLPQTEISQFTAALSGLWGFYRAFAFSQDGTIQ